MLKTKKIKIRYLRFSDAQEATDIYNSSLLSLSRNEPISQEKMRELIEKSNKKFFIGLFSDNQLMGHLLLIAKNDKIKALDIGIVIHSEYQRRGFGCILLKKALAIANANGYKKIIAEILEYNNNSISFFEKNRFEIMGKSDRKIIKDGKKIELLRYEYVLDKAR